MAKALGWTKVKKKPKKADWKKTKPKGPKK